MCLKGLQSCRLSNFFNFSKISFFFLYISRKHEIRQFQQLSRQSTRRLNLRDPGLIPGRSDSSFHMFLKAYFHCFICKFTSNLVAFRLSSNFLFTHPSVKLASLSLQMIPNCKRQLTRNFESCSQFPIPSSHIHNTFH